MNLQDLYEIAQKHKDEHLEGKRRCGGEPYKSYTKLFKMIEEFSKQNKVVKILEVGTAVGFSTYILQKASGAQVDTVEFYQVHVDLAKKNILDWGAEINKVNFFVGDASEILPTLSSDSYDIIFFDGFGVKYFFYKQFERLLKTGGLLITANIFLKSTEEKYFQEIKESTRWKLAEEFDDTQVHKKIL